MTCARRWSPRTASSRRLELYARFSDAFPTAYRADWSAPGAVVDIDRIGELERSGRPILALYRTLREGEEVSRCKLLSADRVLLSDVLPTFEHMGAKVVDERPYEIRPAGSQTIWVYDFGLRSPAEQLERSGPAFAEAFLAVWAGELEDDGLNGLVLAAGLTGREVTIIRAVARYLRQATFAFSDRYMERTLVSNAQVAALLVRLFAARFDPERHDEALAGQLQEEIEHAIDAVRSLDEDRILRSFLAVIGAMLRTNYFRSDTAGKPLHYISFKLDPSKLALLPPPRPRFEIFVYSPRTEGIHLRGGKVARGGLRWSDRREDFRTEVLGLMKAQMVKNALIVPVGSKGGFVVKRPPPDGGREALINQAIACYREFLRGLLDLTDNYEGDRVVVPERVVRYDDDDPYLVVAADKGTAKFSDIANDVADEYGFWLGDAFASGGSHGYDHKQMGITARGAWESVKRHFRELGRDIQQQDFTVVGIGDMSGDVFGNGMLCSEHTRLLAAFNHLHVFLDPNPDPATSYAERRRLFELPRSSWSDYDESLISDGGGVFERSAKSIPISAGGPRRARDRRPGARPGRADPQVAVRACRSALQRRHRHVCQGRRREPGGRRRQGQRCGAGRWRRASLPRRRRGRQSRLHAARTGRVRAARRSERRRRADLHRRDRQRRGRQHLRPRGQHQDPAELRDRRRADDGRRAQRAVGRDDRRGRRAGVVRELHPDPGDEPRARAGA